MGNAECNLKKGGDSPKWSLSPFFNYIQHVPLQSNITCFKVKQLQYGYI
jgi:hypothetical protein